MINLEKVYVLIGATGRLIDQMAPFDDFFEVPFCFEEELGCFIIGQFVIIRYHPLQGHFPLSVLNRADRCLPLTIPLWEFGVGAIRVGLSVAPNGGKYTFFGVALVPENLIRLDILVREQPLVGLVLLIH